MYVYALFGEEEIVDYGTCVPTVLIALSSSQIARESIEII